MGASAEPHWQPTDADAQGPEGAHEVPPWFGDTAFMPILFPRVLLVGAAILANATVVLLVTRGI